MTGMASCWRGAGIAVPRAMGPANLSSGSFRKDEVPPQVSLELEASRSCSATSSNDYKIGSKTQYVSLFDMK